MLRPLITRASKPVFLSSVAIKLEDKESPMKPVSGDFARTANLLEVVIRLPANGLVTNIKGFSELNGSMPGGQFLYSKYVPNPMPPKKAVNTAWSNGTCFDDSVVRSINRYFLWYPIACSLSSGLTREEENTIARFENYSPVI